MDNTQAITLEGVVDKHEFLENPLDVYESYTYNIEWFVVDRDADLKFQEFGETLNVVSVVNDGWPGVEDTKITIAKTGVTTEFNIIDLSVESSGAGIAETSKIAGTALNLEFSVVEVGETSLVDNLQNAIALTGWKAIDSTHFYIKVNFLGVDSKGTKIKIPQTKVFTFTLKSVIRLQTQTDARGTTTLLRGTILQDSVIGDKLTISSTETGFTYKVGETLYDTLGVTGDDDTPKEGSFIDVLNNQVKLTHPNLLENLQHTYKISMSSAFEKEFGQTSTRGITASTIVNMEPQIASQVGQVAPLMNIFEIINDICLNAIKIKKELTEGNTGQSKVFKITPWMIPKKNGWNAITGTMAYNVEFYIDYEKKLVTQNSVDAINKAANINTTVEELFGEYHINKIYHYLFTGKNDQILDFNITLDQYLAKTYSSPTDWFAYENILKAGTVEGNKLLEGYKNKWEQSVEEEKELLETEKTIAANIESQAKELINSDNSLRNDLLEAYMSLHGSPRSFSHGARMKHTKELLENKTNEEIMAEITKMEGERSDWFQSNLSTKFQNKKKLEVILSKLKEEQRLFQNELTAKQKSMRSLYEDFIASSASVSGEENWNNGAKQNAQKMLSGVANKNPKNMILLEELDNDIISKMSNEDFKSILKSQVNNPVVYKSLIRTLSRNKGTPTLKSTDAENVDLARAKYYESKSGHASMIHAQMTIKGDPHWIDGYMPPAVAKKEFGNVGAVSQRGYSMQTTTNGYNYIIVKSGVAHGTDLHDNIFRRNLITHLYTVTGITSDFTGGLFTQILTLNRLTDTDDMVSIIPKVGPRLVETGDKNDNEQNEETDQEIEDFLNQYPDQTTIITGEDEGETEDKGERITTFNEEIFEDSWSKYHNRDVEAENEYKENMKKLKEMMKLHGNRSGPGQKPIYTIPKHLLNKNTVKNATKQALTTDNTIAAQNTMVGHFNPTSSAIVRRNLAYETLEQLPALHQACKNEQTSKDYPRLMVVTGCDAIKNTNSDMLESFGLTIDDQGEASTITAMNTQINNWIATDGITFTDEEIAVYQIAAGGQLNITGHDQNDIQKLVKIATGERSAKVILDEQANDIPSEVVSSGDSGGTNDSLILNGSKSVNNDTVKGTTINTRKLQNYHNSDGSIKTEADIKAEYEAIKALDYPLSPCDAACRTAKYILLAKVDLDATIAREMLDELQKNKVDSIVKKACPDEHANSFFTDSREFECVPIMPNTLTDKELNDIETLKAEANEVFYNNYYTEAGIETEKTWKDNAIALIEKEINDDDLVISDKDKTELKLAVVESINSKVALSELSEDEYSEIKEYEQGINTVIADANDGHRDDLTTAVGVLAAEDELVELNTELNEANTELTQYFWDVKGNRIWAEKKENIEAQMAELMLGQPNEKMTAVVTTISGFDHTYTPIFNPTDTLNDSPVIIKNTETGQYDVVLSGADSTYEGVNEDYLDQLADAKSLFYHLTRMDRPADITTYTDDLGVVYNVKNFSDIPKWDLPDGTEITSPSATFGLYTLDENNVYPGNKKDYVAVRQQVADYFPNIEIISSINGFAPTLSTLKNNTGQIILNGTAFIINPSP